MNDIVIHRGIAPNEEETVTKVGFQGYNQAPLLLVYREYIKDGKVVWAEVLYLFDGDEDIPTSNKKGSLAC
jgi:hypothetical protein